MTLRDALARSRSATPVAMARKPPHQYLATYNSRATPPVAVVRFSDEWNCSAGPPPREVVDVMLEGDLDDELDWQPRDRT